MPNFNHDAGQSIDSQRRALAERTVARQYLHQPELVQRYGEVGRAKCVQDTEYHLAYLAVAVTFSSPDIYRDYIAWAKTVLSAYRVELHDVEQNLRCLRDVLNEELPAGPREAVAPYLDVALETLPAAPVTVPSTINGDDAISALARRYLQTLLRVERHEAARLILDAVRDGTSIPDIYLGVFQRCQREIGRLWQLKQITVAQEHYCTAATQLIMSQLYPSLFNQTRKDRRLVAASVGGELHEVGLRIVTDLLEADGWDTVYLGANVPSLAIVQTVQQHRADLLVISATMSFHLPAVQQLISLVRSSEGGQNLKILVGGYPFNVDRELWRRVGADGSATDANEALRLANRLVGDRTGERGDPAFAPVEIQTGETMPEPERSHSDVPLYTELSRLNNELLTTQRELARKNAHLERLNERLAEADRRKDEFLAMLAHELRNPLAPLRNAAHLLQQPGLDQPFIERTGEMMGRQVQHLGRLVDDLLDLSRIARGKMQLRRERVELGQIVRRAADVSRPLMEARRHELNVSVPPTPVRLLADPTRMEQVFTNLLTNAARYTPDGGRVWLTATVEGADAVIRVRDTGIGIPSEMLSGIFGLFAQTGRAEERSESGLGIGLALVKSLTELHGGRVEVHSAGAGRGSEFVVRWPIAAEEASRIAPVAPTKAAAVERSIHVLLVDDSKDAAESLAMLLRLWGHEVAVAYDGPAALRAAQGRPPQVALLDIGMPGMDGYELARQLRPQTHPKQPVLVALTGWGQEEDRRRSAEAGFDHHLVKPVELSALQNLLTQIVLEGSAV